jgi:hypothetical protein
LTPIDLTYLFIYSLFLRFEELKAAAVWAIFMLISFLPTILLLSAVEVLLGYWPKVAQDMSGSDK